MKEFAQRLVGAGFWYASDRLQKDVELLEEAARRGRLIVANSGKCIGERAGDPPAAVSEDPDLTSGSSPAGQLD